MTVFNVGGNQLRLIAFVVYHRRRIFIHKILTHAEYDRQSRDGTLGNDELVIVPSLGDVATTTYNSWGVGMATTLGFSILHVLRDEAVYEAAMTEITNLLPHPRVPGSPEDERL